MLKNIMLEVKNRISASLIIWLVMLLVAGIVGCGQNQPQAENNNTADDSNSNTTIVATPEGLSGVAGDTIINLSWQANSSTNIKGYQISRSIGSNEAYTIIRTLDNVNTFEDTDLIMSNSYYYKITALDNSGNASNYSNEICFLPKEKYVFVSDFLVKKGTEAEQLKEPEFLAVDDTGYIYITDYEKHYVKKFDASGNFITRWGGYSPSQEGFGLFANPTGIAISRFGNIFVGDLAARIQAFSSSGVFLRQWGSDGTGNGQFNDIRGIALNEPIGSSSYLFAVDFYNHCVQKFDLNGVFISKWGSYGTLNGEFDHPWGIAVDGNGNVYVSDNNYIRKFSSADGLTYSFVKRWQTIGNNSRATTPYSITCDQNGNVFVLLTDRIKKYDCEGNFITDWAIDWGWLGIAIDSQGQIYAIDVSDSTGYRIKKYKKV